MKYVCITWRLINWLLCVCWCETQYHIQHIRMSSNFHFYLPFLWCDVVFYCLSPSLKNPKTGVQLSTTKQIKRSLFLALSQNEITYMRLPSTISYQFSITIRLILKSIVTEKRNPYNYYKCCYSAVVYTVCDEQRSNEQREYFRKHSSSHLLTPI